MTPTPHEAARRAAEILLDWLHDNPQVSPEIELDHTTREFAAAIAQAEQARDSARALNRHLEASIAKNADVAILRHELTQIEQERDNWKREYDGLYVDHMTLLDLVRDLKTAVTQAEQRAREWEIVAGHLEAKLIDVQRRARALEGALREVNECSPWPPNPN